jgi:FAD-dependent oxidoreductase domain-containing protein 1
MSQYGAQFLREMGKRLHVEGHDVPDVQFTPQGYLFLASESGAEQLHKNYILQE